MFVVVNFTQRDSYLVCSLCSIKHLSISFYFQHFYASKLKPLWYHLYHGAICAVLVARYRYQVWWARVNIFITCGPYAMPGAGVFHDRGFKLPTSGRTFTCNHVRSSFQFLKLVHKLPVQPLIDRSPSKPGQAKWYIPSERETIKWIKLPWMTLGIIIPGSWITIVTAGVPKTSGFTFPTHE